VLKDVLRVPFKIRSSLEVVVRGKWVVVAFLGLLLGGTLFAQQKSMEKSQQSMLNSGDRSFITKAAEANLAEIDAAKLVDQKSTDPAVKDFASRMLKDHTQANQELTAMAKTNGVTAPTEAGAAEQRQIDELRKLSGTKLNDTYLQNELQGHKQVISEFEQELDHGQDQAVKNYAAQTLPTLQDHIRIAEDVVGKMGMSGKAGLSDEANAINVK
jgi:putative membrane protein